MRRSDDETTKPSSRSLLTRHHAPDPAVSRKPQLKLDRYCLAAAWLIEECLSEGSGAGRRIYSACIAYSNLFESEGVFTTLIE